MSDAGLHSTAQQSTPPVARRPSYRFTDTDTDTDGDGDRGSARDPSCGQSSSRYSRDESIDSTAAGDVCASRSTDCRGTRVTGYQSARRIGSACDDMTHETSHCEYSRFELSVGYTQTIFESSNLLCVSGPLHLGPDPAEDGSLRRIAASDPRIADKWS
eukprot:CAMPEP_0182426416 /NCGR_PEP_ID=MMETSP1167-20130531/12909_1 /TAXON_ID=2988 /ORGANISM="Mallomonas Sp, Strain CCMP3275" /LENGTH=158 /DNA_ID=CAMNT_0024607827 /DNA_START=25 /DNA_END=501 /DNA_ORIENTATION=-